MRRVVLISRTHGKITMLNEPDWSNDNEYPKKWVKLGNLTIMYLKINGTWHESEVRYNVVLPSPSQPLATSEIEKLRDSY